MGNSRLVAAGHYLQVTDADWQRATGCADSGAHSTHFAAQHRPASIRNNRSESPEVLENEGVLRAGADAREVTQKRESTPRRTRTFNPLIKSQLPKPGKSL